MPFMRSTMPPPATSSPRRRGTSVLVVSLAQMRRVRRGRWCLPRLWIPRSAPALTSRNGKVSARKSTSNTTPHHPPQPSQITQCEILESFVRMANTKFVATGPLRSSLTSAPPSPASLPSLSQPSPRSRPLRWAGVSSSRCRRTSEFSAPTPSSGYRRQGWGSSPALAGPTGFQT